MKAPTIITSMARALGIVSATEDIVIVPVDEWNEMRAEVDRLRKAVDEARDSLVVNVDHDDAPGSP